jgi:hypothetical protein
LAVTIVPKRVITATHLSLLVDVIVEPWTPLAGTRIISKPAVLASPLASDAARAPISSKVMVG